MHQRQEQLTAASWNLYAFPAVLLSKGNSYEVPDCHFPPPISIFPFLGSYLSRHVASLLLQSSSFHRYFSDRDHIRIVFIPCLILTIFFKAELVVIYEYFTWRFRPTDIG